MIQTAFLRWKIFFLLISFCLALTNCQSPAKTYSLTGRVLSKQPVTQQLIIDGDKIPGFMPAMTMPYAVKDPDGFEKTAPSDLIRAQLVVGAGNQFWLEHVVVTGKAAPQAAASGVAPHALLIGEKVPDVPMVNQDGKTIHFAQFKGMAVLLTFIYTRCPFPDFCPLLSSRFAAIQSELANNGNEYKQTHLISISLDPDDDKPAVMREYGLKYLNHDPAGFQHWDFVSTTPADLKKLVAEFGVDYSEDQGQISHTLNTILLAPDGTVAEMWSGNEWQTAEVLDVTRHALAFKN